MSEEFKPGDIVRLKSGGPRMTVESVSTSQPTGTRVAQCLWFEGDTRHQNEFALQALEVAPPTHKGPVNVVRTRPGSRRI